MIKSKFLKLIIYILIVFMTCISFPLQSFAKDEQSISIIPFEIISKDDITYIQSGILKMLYSRLVWKDRVNLVQQDIILKHLKNNKKLSIKKLADLTGSDYILTGSITNFSNAFSIDTKIYDIKKQQYLTFSDQSKIIDDVIPKLNAITARINKKIFKRETIAWEELGKKEKERDLQWQRQNPEKMMPFIPKGMQEEKTAFWKVWEYL